MSFRKLHVYTEMPLLNHTATIAYMRKTLQQKPLLESTAKIGLMNVT